MTAPVSEALAQSAQKAIQLALQNGVSVTKQPRQPVSVLTYGPMKTGKSVDLGYAFSCAINIARPDALESVRSMVGYAPTVVSIARLNDIVAFMWAVAAEVARRKAPLQAIVIDDFSQVLAGEVAHLGVEQKSDPNPKERNNNFAKFDKVQVAMLGFQDAARALLDAGVFVLANAHEGDPKTNDKGKYTPGGPAAPGQLQGTVGGYFSVLLRVSTSDRPRPRWKFAYDNDPGHGQFVTGDRLDVAYPDAPMNLGELLRAGGYNVPRIKGLEWGEDMVAQIAEMLAKLPPIVAGQPDTAAQQRQAILAGAFNQLRSKGVTKHHIDWVLRDAFDRATIRLDSARRFEESWCAFDSSGKTDTGF